MRYYIYISLVAFLSVFCFNNAMGQARTRFGGQGGATDSAFTMNQLLLKAYATATPNMFLKMTSTGHVVLAVPAGSGGGSVDSVTISNDSLFYWGGGVSFFVGIVNSGGSIDTTGLSDRIAYNLTRIDGLSDTATLHADSLEAHKDWLSSIESEIAAIPIANDFQSVLDNGNTSNKDFIIDRSSYTGYTRIGDGISSIYPPNSSRVSFYVTSKTSGQGAGSGIGYGIQSLAEYTDTVGFLSSTTLIGSKGTAVATSSTPGGGLYDHEFTNGSAAANMSGLIGEALTFGNSYSTSAAGVTAIVEPFQQSHIGFGASFLSIGTRRRTGTTLDSIAGLYVQQRNYALGSGTLKGNFGVWIDSMIAGDVNYGIFYKNNPGNGSIATAPGHDFSIKTGVGGATKIHSSAYIFDTTFSQDEVYTPNLPRGTQDSVVYIAPDGRHYKGVVPDTIEAGDGIIATKGARKVTLTTDTTYLETMFFKNYGNSFGDDFKMGNMNWNQFIYGDGNGDFIFNNGSGPGWMFHFVQNDQDTVMTINTQNEVLIGSVAKSAVDAGSYKLQVQGNVYIRDSIFIANPLKAATKDTVLAWQSGKVYAIPKPAGGSADSTTFAPNYRVDTAKTNLRTQIAAKEPTITAGTSSDYWQGDKTWQPKSGLPISTTTQTALNAKIAYSDTNVVVGTKHDIDTLATSIYAAGYLPAATAVSTYVSLSGSYSNPTWITALAWSKITGTPTTLAGYNISDAQPLDADLTAIAGLSPTNDDILQRKAGSWINRTMAQLKTDLALTKSDVGLSNVDNTADASKNVATAATLTTARNIDNTSFNGSGPIVLPRVWQGKLAGELDTLTTGVKLTFRMPYACTITGVKAAVNTASSSGNITIDIHENGTTIMSTTKITINATETSSLAVGTTQPVLTDTSIAADALIQVEVDAAGTNAISGEVTIYYTLQ